ncbi:hypothetical protein [Yersinia wautersii]|uniref:hypothetical protein n=1 Tax=Yersinia wautersii TaxID=1341643 RepID=UPI001EE29D88|nr:hypothetical protein [Yersinia wautersii]
MLFRVTTGYAGTITLNNNESGRVVIVEFLLSTYIGADSNKVGDVITDAVAYVSMSHMVSGQITQGATNSAYQCEIENSGSRWSKLKVRKLQAGYAGEATCVAEVKTRLRPGESWDRVSMYVYNELTANSAYGPSYATLTPYGRRFNLPRPWGPGDAWDGVYYYPKGGVSKWSATYDEEIRYNVSESNPYVPILTVTDDSTTWAFVTAMTKDVDAGFTTAVRIARMGGEPCSWVNIGEQCFMYVDKDKLRPGTTKGQIVLNVRLP